MLQNCPLHLDFTIREFPYFFTKCGKTLTTNNFARVRSVGSMVLLAEKNYMYARPCVIIFSLKRQNSTILPFQTILEFPYFLARMCY